jgi:hypothetical protein
MWCAARLSFLEHTQHKPAAVVDALIKNAKTHGDSGEPGKGWSGPQACQIDSIPQILAEGYARTGGSRVSQSDVSVSVLDVRDMRIDSA